MDQTRETDADRLIEVVRRGPALAALADGPIDRRELERRLDVSRATAHRITRSLDDIGLLHRVDGDYALTELGRDVADAVGAFEATVAPRLRLGPLLDAVRGVGPAVEASAFVDATVTSAERGDANSPMVRFVDLLDGTDAVRGFDIGAVAPLYLREVRRRIHGGVAVEVVDEPDVIADVLAAYPERCAEVCASDNLSIRLREGLPFALAIFDGRVGVGVREPAGRRLRLFVDTPSAEAREWAEAVYESYRADSVRLPEFTERGFREALAGA